MAVHPSKLMAAALLACVGLSACGGRGTAKVTARVHGAVTAGPTCPVQRVDQPCPPRPVQGTVSAQDAGGRTVATTRTQIDGRYALSLAPGQYTLTVDTGSQFPRCRPVNVTVPQGRVVQADIGCDTGIR